MYLLSTFPQCSKSLFTQFGFYSTSSGTQADYSTHCALGAGSLNQAGQAPITQMDASLNLDGLQAPSAIRFTWPQSALHICKEAPYSRIF